VRTNSYGKSKIYFGFDTARIFVGANMFEVSPKAVGFVVVHIVALSADLARTLAKMHDT
jgi:hypothetical protein